MPRRISKNFEPHGDRVKCFGDRKEVRTARRERRQGLYLSALELSTYTIGGKSKIEVQPEAAPVIEHGIDQGSM